MNKYVFLFVIVVLFTVFSVPAEAAAMKKWTVMCFLNGDNNLSSAGDKDVKEMEKVGSTDDVNIICLHDRYGSNDTRLLYVKKGSSDVIETGEVNTGDWNKVVEYGKKMIDLYPAEHYMFIIWNHGAGIRNKTEINPMTRGISYDDSSNHAHLTIAELGKAIRAISAHRGKKIDIYGSDACLMAMPEIAYELKDACDFVVGSEETEPGDGWPYDKFLAPLAANPNMSSKEFAKVVVEQYCESYDGGSQGSSAVTQSAIDQSKIGYYVETLVNDLAEAIIDHPEENSNILSAVNACQKYAYAEMKDIYHLCELLKSKVSSYDIRNAAQAIIDDRDNLNTVCADANTGGKVSNSHGLAIFFPSKSEYSKLKSIYKTLAMSNPDVCKWDLAVGGIYFPKTPVIQFNAVSFVDQNNETKINPGDTITFKIKLSNEGSDTARSVRLELRSDDNNTSIIDSSISSFDVNGLGEIEKTMRARVDSDCEGNHTLTYKLIAKWDGKEAVKEVNILVRKPFAVANKVLLVVKDIEDDFSSYYLTALSKAGIKFDVWDVKVEEEITLSTLKQYANGVVIFNAPSSGTDATVIKTEYLQDYLNAGGNLFITGQDVGYKLKSHSFYKDNLHAKYIQDNTGIHSLRGKNLFSGMNISISGGDGANNQKWPDEIDALDSAEELFIYDNSASKINVCPDTENIKADQTKGVNSSGCGALKYSDATQSIVYFSFGFEAISTKENRTAVMKKVVETLMPSFKSSLERLVALNSKRVKMIDSIGIDAEENESYIKALDNVNDFSKLISNELLQDLKSLKFNRIFELIDYAKENENARQELRPIIQSLKETIFNSRNAFNNTDLEELENL